jgi:NAD-dependent SIR2 family protein deacetylase
MVKQLIFFGAGASKEFGIPTMREMVEKFLNEIKGENNNNNKENNLFIDIYETLKKDMNSNVDLEAIFTVLEGLKELDLKKTDKVIESYICNKICSQSLKEYYNKSSINKETITNLENKYKYFIRRECKTLKEKKILIKKVYTNLFNSVSQKFKNIEHNDYNEYKIRIDKTNINLGEKWIFFTTNYDDSLEYFFGLIDDGDILNTGFIQKGKRRIMDPELFMRTGLFLSNKYKLVKLHGSINWLEESDGTIVEEDSDLDKASEKYEPDRYIDEKIIYPLSQKHLYFSPFIESFYLLNKALSEIDIWIIIGYSFRDSIIRNLFTKNLKNHKKKIIIVHPHEKEIVGLDDFKKISNNIEIINAYFAQNNYDKVNEDIANKIFDSHKK